MKLPKIPNLSYKSYVRHLRRQNIHVQRLHAIVFASVITGMTAFLILYYDYGFFHDVYVQKEEPVEVVDEVHPPSPTETLTGFFSEAKKRFGSIGAGSADLLEGKDTYINNSTTTP